MFWDHERLDAESQNESLEYSGLESRMTEIEDMIKKRNAAAEAYARQPTAYYGQNARPSTTPAVPPGPTGLS